MPYMSNKPKPVAIGGRQAQSSAGRKGQPSGGRKVSSGGTANKGTRKPSASAINPIARRPKIGK